MASKPPSEADIIFNRANIALARSQRLVASWLPPRTTTPSDQSSTENKPDDDDEIFTAVPERLGLGAPVPVKDAFNSLNSSSGSNKLDDKLRQRLLGRNAKKFMQQQQQQKQQQQQQQQAAAARGRTGQSGEGNSQGGKTVDIEEEEDDEEESRTSLVRKKRQMHAEKLGNHEPDENSTGLDATGTVQTNADKTTTPQIPVVPTMPSSKRKKTGKVSYLDELLQDRKKKKKKQQQQ